MNTLEDLLGIDPEDPSVQRARTLASNDRKLLEALVDIRIEKGLTQGAVGEKMGISQPSVAAFESVGSNPKLSTIRRYAQAIGALIRHEVSADEGQLKDNSIEHHWKTVHLKTPKKESGITSIPIKASPGAASFRFETNRIVSAPKSKRTDFSLAA